MVDDPQTENAEKSPPVFSVAKPGRANRRTGQYICTGLCGVGCAFLFAIFGPSVLNAALWIISKQKINELWEPDSPLSYVPLFFLGGIVGVFVGAQAFRLLQRMDQRWDQMEVGDRVTVFLGFIAGLIATLPFVPLLNALTLPSVDRGLLVLALALGFVALSAYVLQSVSEVLPWNRNRVATKRSGIKILDTNVIIDARVYEVAQKGFLEGEIYVPQFVLEELQHIADHHDALKRARGRRGLDMLKHMQAEFPVEIGKYDHYAPNTNEEVDARLVRIAKAIGADIVTNDFNLNGVAKLQNVKILSLNELALCLRPNVLPSETLELAINREGKEPGQGVGYLEDGTMVVVEGGRTHIGETVEVTVTQVIQTERGKMIFAEVDGEMDPDDVYNTRRRRR